MADLTLRSVKGTLLTNQEVDDNFTSLNNQKLETTNNLSDLTNPTEARTNLGLTVGVDVLAPNGDGSQLTGISITESQISDLGSYVPQNSAQALGSAPNVLTLTGDNLTLLRGDGTTDAVSLAAYLDEDSRSIATASLNATTGVITFTRDDGSTFTLDASALLDDTNLVTSVAGKAGVVTLNKNDVGLSNVDNTSDFSKPISTATQAALNEKASTADVGTLSFLTTADKTNLVNAVNEVNAVASSAVTQSDVSAAAQQQAVAMAIVFGA